MFRRKYSDVLHEKDTKTGKRSQRFGWLHLLVIPCFMSFTLLIMLVNVDSSGIDGKQVNLTEELGSINLFKSLQPYDYPSVLSDKCHVNNNGCRIRCMRAKNDQNLISLLESQYKICKGPMDLDLSDTKFEQDTFGQNDLVGNFILANLTLEFCELRIILNNSFNKMSLNNLKVLKILKSKITNMNEKTFAGLKTLQTFEMSNVLGGNMELSATAMFKPMAKSLCEIFFVNMQFLSAEFYPEHWFQGAEFIKLKNVNFKGNYFSNTLNRNSFMNLKNVEILNLQLCGLSVLAHDTFDSIITTLSFLNLSFNQLKMLDAHLVENFANARVKLALENNRWDCNCDNCELIKTLKNGNIKLSEDPMCRTPAEFLYTPIKLVELRCCENNEETTEETTTMNTKTVTNDAIKTSDSATKVTESTSIVTTTESYTLIEIKCKQFPSENQTIIHAVKDQLVAFNLKTVKLTKVIITVQVISENAIFVFFSAQKSESARYQILYDTVIEIENLVPAQTYVFCLTLTNFRLISPFNCRSHHMSVAVLKLEPWLKSSDMPVFIALTTIGVIICLLIGIVLSYALLRWRPHLIRQQLDTFSNELCSHKSSSTFKFNNADEVLSTCNSIYQLRPNEYVKYFRSTELPTSKIEAKILQENLPPNQRAPALPPLSELCIVSKKSTLPTSDAFSKDTIPEYLNEHVYQSLDEYHGIYELK